MARFSPQPFGTGQIFPIASSLVAKIRSVFVSPRFSHSEKSAPVAAVLLVLIGPNGHYPYPFIDVTKLGYAGVLGNIGFFVIFFPGVGLSAIAIGRRLRSTP
jgi:hypothetical protein